MTNDEFLKSIEDFLEETQIRPSRFGMDAMGDPSFVRQLREGRSCSLDTVERVTKYMASNRTPAGAVE